MSKWIDDLPEPLRDAPFLSKAESAEAALEALKHAGNHVGNSLRYPDKTASEDDVAGFLDKALEKFPQLMRKPGDDAVPPSEADKYPDIVDDDGNALPTDLTIKEMAFKAGLSEKQFKELYGPQLAQRATEKATADAAHAQQIGQLKSEWGQAYDAKMEGIATLLANTEAPSYVTAQFETGQLTRDDLRWLDQWATATRETVQNKARDTTTNLQMTKAEAEAKIADILNDEDFFEPSSPRYQALQKRRMDLDYVAMGMTPP